MTGLVPFPTTPAAPRQQTPEEAREEFDKLSLALRQHQSKDVIMEDAVYKRTLQRALDLITSFNQTTAGPAKAAKKIGVTKKAPLTLADL